MNDAKAIELAMTDVVREFCSLGDAELRAWRALQDSAVNSDHERKFPCVDIRASSPESAANSRSARMVTVSIQVLTLVDKDKNHSRIETLEDELQSLVWALFDQGPVNKASDERNAFTESLTKNAPELTLSGFTVGTGDMPMDQDGLNTVSCAITVHYIKAVS